MNCIRCERSAVVHKQGFTLMELVVYMAIVGIIVIVAGQAFSNSTKFRVRTQNMLKATQEAENVATFFKTDVSQMGAKIAQNAVVAGGEDVFSSIYKDVYIDPDNPTADLRDSSSFDVTTDVLVEDGVQKRYSNLKMLYITYDDDGHYQSVQEVKWFVRNKTLKRTCLTKAGTEDERCPKEGDPDTAYVASGVEKFNIIVPTPAARLANVPVFPPASDGGVFRLVARSGGDIYAPLQITNGSSEGVGGPKQVLSNFFSNYDNDHDAVLDPTNRKINQLFAVRADATSETEWNALCTSLGSITLEPDNEYQLSFFVPYIENKSRMFVPGVDHMSVGFRSIATGEPPQKAGKNLLDDFIFFPPLDVNGKGTRNMRFTVPEQLTDLCIAFTFASYSPLVSQGAVTIENLKLTKVATSNYDFGTPLYTSSNTGIATTDIKEKKNVKALRVELQIGRGGKKDVSGVKQAGETGEVNMTIPIPSNGPRD